MRWGIFYVDGNVFTHEDGAPEDAPGCGVAAIVTEDISVGSAVHCSNDFYVFAKQYGGWYGLDNFGFAQYLSRPGLKIVKLGESMQHVEYVALIKRIKDDPRLPTKNSRYPWEEPMS